VNETNYETNTAQHPLSFLNISFISVLATLACFALLYLSQFAQMAPAQNQLQLIVIIFMGLLFVGAVYPIIARQKGNSWHTASVFVAVVISAIVAFALTRVNVLSPAENINSLQGSMAYVLCPVVALTLAILYGVLFKNNAQLFVAITVYVMCAVLANYTLDAFIPVPITLPAWIPAENFQGLINVGTLFFGIIFTQRDRIHRYGSSWVFFAILITAIATTIASIATNGIAYADIAAAFSSGSLSSIWDFIWNSNNGMRFVVVGVGALVISELVDTGIYQAFINSNWFTRVLSSNAVSAPLDTILFTLFAFWGAEWLVGFQREWMTEVIVTDIVVKIVVATIALIPFFGVSRNRKDQVSAV